MKTVSYTFFTMAFIALFSAQSASAKTLEVGARAEKFSLKVVNSDKVGERNYALNKMIGERAKTPKKLVVLSFFATYCAPCKRELPLLQKLNERYADKGLGVLVVSIDKDKDVPGGASKAIADLAEKNHLSFPVLHDRFNIVAKRYGIEKLPCLYMIDDKGQIAYVNTGYTDDFSEQLVTEVQKRLGVPVEPIEEKTAAEPGKKAKKNAKKKHKRKKHKAKKSAAKK